MHNGHISQILNFREGMEEKVREKGGEDRGRGSGGEERE